MLRAVDDLWADPKAASAPITPPVGAFYCRGWSRRSRAWRRRNTGATAKVVVADKVAWNALIDRSLRAADFKHPL